MYTRPSHRGRKIGAMIIERIEALAREEGLTRLVLETGDRHPAAWTVYERAGFTRCGPVLDYPDSKWSVFYEKSPHSIFAPLALMMGRPAFPLGAEVGGGFHRVGIGDRLDRQGAQIGLQRLVGHDPAGGLGDRVHDVGWRPRRQGDRIDGRDQHVGQAALAGGRQLGHDGGALLGADRQIAQLACLVVAATSCRSCRAASRPRPTAPPEPAELLPL